MVYTSPIGMNLSTIFSATTCFTSLPAGRICGSEVNCNRYATAALKKKLRDKMAPSRVGGIGGLIRTSLKLPCTPPSHFFVHT